MNIAIITSRYPNKDEPYSHMFVHMRSLEMKKKGSNVVIFIPSKTTLEYTFENITVKSMPNNEIVKNLNQYDIAYLHLLNIYPFQKKNGRLIHKYLMKSNMPFAMYIHGSDVQKFVWSHEFNYKFIDLLKWVNKDFFVIPKIKNFIKKTKERENVAFIFPSNWIKNDAERNLKLTFNNAKIIPNGVDVDLFSFNETYNNRYKLLNLRPFSCKKYAVDIAIETMRFLPKKYTLDIYGKGLFEEKYKKLITKYCLNDRVKITNKFFNRNELNTFFSNYGVFLAPSRMDTQGLIVCEAMASGLLIASSNNTGIPEFVTKNTTGILENSPKELATQIIEITKDQELFNKMVKKGRISMENIKIETTISKEMRILKNLIK